MSSVLQALPDAARWHYRAGAAGLQLSAPGMPGGATAPCAAEAAVVLDLAGDLLDALDAAGLVPAAPWHWAPQPALPATGARGQWQGRDVQATLTLPWASLRALSAAPDLPGLQWLAVPAECVLAQWRFTEAELVALEPGGALLLDAPCHRPRPRSEPAAAGDLPWQLVARWDEPVPLPCLMGWAPGLPPLPDAALLVETAWPDAVLARGRLMPWGSGQALRIEGC